MTGRPTEVWCVKRTAVEVTTGRRPRAVTCQDVSSVLRRYVQEGVLAGGDDDCKRVIKPGCLGIDVVVEDGMAVFVLETRRKNGKRKTQEFGPGARR